VLAPLRQQGYHKSKWELDTSEEHLGMFFCKFHSHIDGNDLLLLTVVLVVEFVIGGIVTPCVLCVIVCDRGDG